MKKVYITKASLKRILKSFGGENRLEHNELASKLADEGNIFEQQIWTGFFNTKELQELHKFALFLQDFKSFKKQILLNKKIIDEQVDFSNEIYVLTVDSPAFHLTPNCQWLHSDFQNIEKPTSLDEKNYRLFCLWIKSNKHLSKEVLNREFQQKFHTTENLRFVELPNSGSIEYHFNPQIDFQAISDVKGQLRFMLDDKFAKKISNIKYMPHHKLHSYIKDLDDKELQIVLSEFSKSKQLFQTLFENYIITKYNEDFSFDINVLKSIGFRLCKSCEKEYAYGVYCSHAA